MTNKLLYGFGGLSAILSGLTIISGKILAIASLDSYGEFFDFLSPLFGLFAVVAIYLWHRKKTGLFGFVAFVTLFSGISMVLCLDYFGAFILPYLPEGLIDQLIEGPTGTVLAISGLIFLSGVIMFGISIIWAREFPLITCLIFIAGFIPVPFVGLFPDAITYAGSIIAGLGLCSWGICLVKYRSLESSHL